MSTLALECLDGRSIERQEGITCLIAEDPSGQFGLLPGHEALVTALQPGLIRYRLKNDQWRYLACSGGVLVCRNNLVQVTSARFLSAEQDNQLTEQLEHQLEKEKGDRRADLQSRAELERALIKRLREWSEAHRP